MCIFSVSIYACCVRQYFWCIIMIICSIVIIINSVLTLQVSTAKYPMIADLANRFIPEFAPGSIGSTYTYSGPLSKGRESEHHFWGFPQVILSWSQSVPNNTANEGPMRIQYKCLVPICIPEMKLCILVFSKTELKCSVL